MAHPSQEHPDFGWIDGSNFAKAAGKQSAAGLPSKHIHIDSDYQPAASVQSCGQLYADQIDSAVNAAPALKCPNCNQTAFGLKGGSQAYTRDIKETGGKTHKGDVPPCPVAGVDIPGLLYFVDPCGCKIAQEWASAFSGELQSRMNSNKPKGLQWLDEKQRRAKLQKLEMSLTRLYKYRAMAGDVETKKDADYWIVIVIDQIQRLCPGAHNKIPAPSQSLHDDVMAWAHQNGLQTPSPAAPAFVAPSDFGYGPEYKMPTVYAKTVNNSVPSAENSKHAATDKSDAHALAFFGAKHAEKEFYLKILGNAKSQTVWPSSIVLSAIDAFLFNKPLMLSLLSQEFLHGCDTIELFDMAGTIEKELSNHVKQSTPLSKTTDAFLQAFSRYVYKPAQVAGPVPAPSPALLEKPRKHCKKRRTIRQVDE